MLHFDRETISFDLRIGEHFVEGVDWRRRYIFGDQPAQPIVALAGAKDRRQLFIQGVVVFHPRFAVVEARILGPLRFADDVEQAQPELIWRRHVQHERQAVLVFEREYPGGGRAMLAPRHMAGLEIARRVFADERDRRAQQ